jgi:transposase
MRGRTIKTPEAVAYARRRREEGAMLKEIAGELGAAISTVGAWLTDPDGLRLAERKDTYRGTCQDCGAPTSGCRGPGKAPTRCVSCIEWTAEQAICAVDEFFAEHHRSPRIHDAIRSDGRLPQEPTAFRLFGGWNAMLLAADLPLNQDRREATQREMEDMLRAGMSAPEVADAFGWTVQNVYQRLRARGLRIADVQRRAA